MSVEQQELANMMKSPGWLIFRSHVDKEWGPAGYGVKIARVVDEAVAAKEDVKTAVLAVNTATNEIHALLKWVEHMAEKRIADTPPVSLQRGGA